MYNKLFLLFSIFCFNGSSFFAQILPFEEIDGINSFRESLYSSEFIFQNISCDLVEYEINTDSDNQLDLRSKENHVKKTAKDPGRAGGYSKYWKEKGN